MLSRLLVIFAFLYATLGSAEAHIAMTSPAPRTSAQKMGPCGAGDSVRGTQQTYSPGETITVSWDETVDHPGHYRIAFLEDGQDFPLPNQPDDNFPSTLVDQIMDKSGGSYSQEITFPDVECDNCTLQLIQIMTTNVPYNSFYFQCVDITLSGPSSEGPDAGGGGGGGNGGFDDDGGCACSTSGPASGIASVLLVLGLWLLLGRRRLPIAVRTGQARR